MLEQTVHLSKNQNGFQLKGSLFTITVLQLLDININNIEVKLHKMAEQTPNFFKNTPIIIDLQKINNVIETKDFTLLMQTLRKAGMLPIGLRGNHSMISKYAAAHSLAVFPVSKTENANITKNKPTPSKQEFAKPLLSRTTKLITQPVRSGQQIYAKNGDLVIVASVSPGAELLADGNIHVYGTLRGRALAGVNGDQTARIFCKKLDPELISIAGHYQVKDNIVLSNSTGFFQIFLDQNHIKIEKI